MDKSMDWKCIMAYSTKSKAGESVKVKSDMEHL
jgi:hypothetical protein